MKQFQIIKRIILSILIVLSTLRITYLFMGLYNYLAGYERYYKGLSPKGKELLDLYFNSHKLNFYFYINSLGHLVGYLFTYLFFKYIIFNENSKIVDFISQFFDYFSSDLYGKDKAVCKRFCTLILLILIGPTCVKFYFYPEYYTLVIFLTFCLLYYIPYNFYVFLLSFQLFFISTLSFMIYHTNYWTLLQNSDIRPYSYHNFIEPIRKFFDKKKFYNFYYTNDGYYVSNAFAYSTYIKKVICIGENFFKDENLQYCLIHEFGHIFRNHSFRIIFFNMMVRLITYTFIIFISLILTAKTNYIRHNKKLHFFAIFSILNFVANSFIFNILRNCFSVKIEYEADNYAIDQGFVWETGYICHAWKYLFKKYNTANWTMSALQVYMNTSHPTEFMRMLNAARKLK